MKPGYRLEKYMSLKGSYMMKRKIRLGGYIVNSNAFVPRLDCTKSSVVNDSIGFNTKAMYSGFHRSNNRREVITKKGLRFAKEGGLNTIVKSRIQLNTGAIILPKQILPPNT